MVGLTQIPAILKGTYYWSCNGSKFQGANPDVNDVFIAVNQGGTYGRSAGIITPSASVELPHGAIVTGVIVYGNNTGGTWTLQKTALDGINPTVMATAAVNSEDTSITSATIDNSTSRYNIFVADLDTAADEINGARITYTL